MTFEEAWATTEKIGGFFERDEAELYWRILRSLPSYAVVIEVGVENGRSTSLPAQYSKHVKPLILHAVDNFSTFGETGAARFYSTMRGIGAPYRLWHNSSAEMAVMPIEPDLILIDADHDDIETDCKTWLPKLKSGGWVLFHDYGRPPWTIKEVVEHYCEGWKGETVNTLAARQKP